MIKKIFICLIASIVCVSAFSQKDKVIKTLIVTGQNNHIWQTSNVVIKQILENSGLFTVDVAISPAQGEDMSGFKPNFSAYQLVVLDYNGDR